MTVDVFSIQISGYILSSPLEEGGGRREVKVFVLHTIVVGGINPTI
tara:strand:+ start:6752 stop:6889 length:138 start_codon:yes stop_codon:yes gene_type:complete